MTLKNFLVNKKINIVIFAIALMASAGAKTKYGINTTSEMWDVFLTRWASAWIQCMLISFIGYKMFSWFKNIKNKKAFKTEN